MKAWDWLRTQPFTLPYVALAVLGGFVIHFNGGTP